jgi:predicted permease
MLSIVIVSSSFYSIALIISEGNGISVLQSLPLTLRDIIYSKNYVGTVIFSIIVIPISTIFLFKNNVDSLILFLLPANLIVAYSYTSLFNLRRLMKKVPKGSTTINFYSFGGNMALLILFAITAGFTAVPAVASTIISIFAVQVPFSHPLSFYLSDLALNLGALFVVMNLVNKTM